jgi:hypothetical protein
MLYPSHPHIIAEPCTHTKGKQNKIVNIAEVLNDNWSNGTEI